MITQEDQAAVGAINTRLQSHLGRRLRQTYDPVVAEQLPDQLASLLTELARREADDSRKTERSA
jgi:hypothetical protein